jgi:hypothetical protein
MFFFGSSAPTWRVIYYAKKRGRGNTQVPFQINGRESAELSYYYYYYYARTWTSPAERKMAPTKELLT